MTLTYRPLWWKLTGITELSAVSSLLYVAIIPPHAHSSSSTTWLAFFFGFFTSALAFFITMKLFPVPGMGEFDDVDYYGAFTEKEAQALGVTPSETFPPLEGVGNIQPLGENEKGPKTGYIFADGVLSCF